MSLCQIAQRIPKRRFFGTSACRSQAPRPAATRPASQAQTTIPANVFELTQRYPRHPLLSFFNRESRKVVVDAESGKTREEMVPVAMNADSMGKTNSGRSWYASELRTKSSVELHQLWYKCLLERNKLATTKAEIQRMGALQYAKIVQYNGPHIEARVRKTMARIKFVLNERRLALLDAQERRLDGTLEQEIQEEPSNLFEGGETSHEAAADSLPSRTS